MREIKRKLVKNGRYTLTIALPSEWIKNHDLKIGDEVVIKEVGDTLAIYPSTTSLKDKTALIDLRKIRNPKKRYLLNPYIEGYNILHIIYKNKEQYNIIKESILLMSNIKSINEKENEIIISFSLPEKEDVNKIIRHLIRDIKNMIRISFSSILNNTFEKQKDLLNKIDNNITRNLLRLKRIFFNNPIYSPKYKLKIYSFLRLLEFLADNLLYVSSLKLNLTLKDLRILEKLSSYDFVKENVALEEADNPLLNLLIHNFNSLLVEYHHYTPSTNY